jgi:hypothetical protein
MMNFTPEQNKHFTTEQKERLAKSIIFFDACIDCGDDWEVAIDQTVEAFTMTPAEAQWLMNNTTTNNETATEEKAEEIAEMIENKMYQCHPAIINIVSVNEFSLKLYWFDGSIESTIKSQNGQYIVSVECHADNMSEWEHAFENPAYAMPQIKAQTVTKERIFALNATSEEIAQYLIDTQKSAI